MIKNRFMKPSSRGLYIQDKELLETVFQPNTNFTFEIDNSNKLITIKPTSESKNTVSKRKLADGRLKPVIDIRDKQVKELLAGAEKINVIIEKDRIFVSVDKDETNVYEIDANSVPSTFKVADDKYKPLQIALDVVALFSGAGMLDAGFVNQGFDIKVAIEKEVAASQTYWLNHNTSILTADIRTIPKHELPKATVVIGGSPCQALSNANRKYRIIDHPNNMLVLEFIETVKANEECKVFVLENVPEILTAGDGRFVKEIEDELNEFEVTSGILSATHYGDPQERRRAFIIGSKIGKIELPQATVTTPKTVGEALQGIYSDMTNQKDVTIPKSETEHKMSFVKQGSNWRDIPKHLLSSGFGKNTHSNTMHRLSPSKPSITLPNVRKANILHPTENRVLSVRECARLFSLPDEFHFFGNLSDKQQQVCNGVPFKLSSAIAKVVKSIIEKFNKNQLIYS